MHSTERNLSHFEPHTLYEKKMFESVNFFKYFVHVVGHLELSLSVSSDKLHLNTITKPTCSWKERICIYDSI